MAAGIIAVIAASSHKSIPLSGTAGNTIFPSAAILNPNDGVAYVARDRDCMGTNQGAWDWKVPSQSYAILPGPMQSLGVFYLDQSGAGRQGELSIYPSQREVDIPLFGAIGRALQAQTTSLDVTEGVLPANPSAGILRLWADASDFLHLLNGAGVDAVVADTLTVLGGSLTGRLPNPGIAPNAVTMGRVVSVAGTSTTSATFADVASLSQSITTLGGLVFGWFSGSMMCSIASATYDVNVNLDGVDDTNMPARIVCKAANANESIAFFHSSQPAAGAHTYKIRWRVLNGATLTLDNAAIARFGLLELRNG